MSKEKISTKEKIIEKALELFNNQGIEYVGVRELAKELEMKGGNITYYFPTKDDIVMELANRLSEENNQIIIKKEDLSLTEFLHILKGAYYNHYKFRSLFISFPNILKQNQKLREKYQQRQLLRQDTILHQLRSLSASGYLKQLSADKLDVLLKNIVIISRFWLSNASIEGEAGPSAAYRYLKLVAGLLSLVATGKGEKDIGKFCAELN